MSGSEETDRVRKFSPASVNEFIDEKIKSTLNFFKGKSQKSIDDRIERLNKEWDVERNIETIAPSLILGGVALGYFVNRKWLILPGVVAAFLLQHGIQGWCPPVSILRAMKIRTRREIDKEKYGLKVLKGDFDKVRTKDPDQISEALGV